MYWALFTLFWFYWKIDGIYFDIILRLLLAFVSQRGSNPVKVAVVPITMVIVAVVNSEK